MHEVRVRKLGHTPIRIAILGRKSATLKSDVHGADMRQMEAWKQDIRWAATNPTVGVVWVGQSDR